MTIHIAPPDATCAPGTFFHRPVFDSDPAIADIIHGEFIRQCTRIELIASENLASCAVMQAQGSIFTNKYAEGYPGRRYYGGCQFADEVETLAIERAKALFGCGYANVQPNSGSQMNQAVFLALLEPGDTFMGMDLSAGGHLTHGARVNMSGKWFKAVPYGVRADTHRLDMDEIADLARRHRPKLIIAGATAYARSWDFKAFRDICDEIGAWLLVDMSHFAGLVAGGVHASPLPYAHVTTTTTHKSLRGPRGGLILTNDEVIARKINSAIFPGLQGGPLMHVIAAKAVALGEALQPRFKLYARQVVDNAKALARSLQRSGIDLVSGGTDNHLLLVDLRSQGVRGKQVEEALDRAWISCNKNTIPNDPESPMVTSGIRLGTPAGTTRGFAGAEFEEIGEMIAQVIAALALSPKGDDQIEALVRERVGALCSRFPVYEGPLGSRMAKAHRMHAPGLVRALAPSDAESD